MYDLDDIEEVDLSQSIFPEYHKQSSNPHGRSLPTECDNINLVYDSLLINGNFAVIMNLINLYSCGIRVKALVNSIIQEQYDYYSLLDHIVTIRHNIMLASNRTEKHAWEEVAVKLLRKYYLLLSVGIYLHETQNTEYESFEQWFNRTNTVKSLYETINLQHIDQYLSVTIDEQFSTVFSDSIRGISGYLNVHTLLLLQQVCDQETHIIAERILLSSPTRMPIFGTIFTKSLVFHFYMLL